MKCGFVQPKHTIQCQDTTVTCVRVYYHGYCLYIIMTTCCMTAAGNGVCDVASVDDINIDI